jgi:hypothetical protein
VVLENFGETSDNCVPMVCYLSGSVNSYAVLPAIFIHRNHHCTQRDTYESQDASPGALEPSGRGDIEMVLKPGKNPQTAGLDLDIFRGFAGSVISDFR